MHGGSACVRDPLGFGGAGHDIDGSLVGRHHLHVRRELWAKVTRALFYDLVALGEERDVGGKAMFGVVSGGQFFAMAEASALREFA